VVREQGWSLVDEELEEGLRSIAVPIRRPDGSVLAAVNVSAHTGRGDAAAIRADLLPHLVSTAAAVERDLRR
jgi:IclR family pca regulon transcriptional regulator